MKKTIIKYILVVLSALMLSGCTDSQCIDADDFGFPTFTISARYDASEIIGANDNQLTPWRNNKLVINGQPLTILVKNWDNNVDNNDIGDVSAWSPWYGSADEGDTKGSTLNHITKRLTNCIWYNNHMATRTKYGRILNAPCLMNKGVGLYGLIPPRGVDPNNPLTQNVPTGSISFHLGEPQNGYSLFDVDREGSSKIAGGLVYQFPDPTAVANSNLYFKILDRFYDDNNGQYKVTIKSGINSPYPDPIQYITALVQQKFFGNPAGDAPVAQTSFFGVPIGGDAGGTANLTGMTNQGVVASIYNNIINNNGYRTTITAFLILYIMFTAFSFLIGTLHITHTELIVRVIKVAMVSALLDPNYGWNFFYNYLFVFFMEGMTEIVNFVNNAANIGPGNSSLLAMLLAPQTLAKVLALLFTTPTGIIYIAIYIILMVFFAFVTFRAAVLYLNCIIMIGMIIIMAPIFISFMLFDFTKSLFENWLKQLISYMIQPIILLTSIAFMSIMIRHEIYATLGFKVCRYDFPDLGPLFSLVNPSSSQSGSGTPKSLFFWFFPVPMIGSEFTNTLTVIPVPEAHKVTKVTAPATIGATRNTTASDGSTTTSNAEVGYQCSPYECNEQRYIDLPFLDPGVPRDMARRANFLIGTWAQFESLIYITILIYLLYKFNESAQSLGKSLAGTAGTSSMDMKGGTEAAIAPVANKMGSMAQKAFDKATMPIRRPLEALGDYISNEAANRYQQSREKTIREDALAGSNQAVLDRVKRDTGLSKSDVDVKSKEKYQFAIADKLKELNPKLTYSDALDKASRADPSRLKDFLAQELHGKTFKDLAEEKQRDIDAILKAKANTGNIDGLREALSETQYGKSFDKLDRATRNALDDVIKGEPESLENMQKLLAEQNIRPLVGNLKDPKVLKDELAKGMFGGKVFDELSNAEKGELSYALSQSAKIKPDELKAMIATKKFGKSIKQLNVSEQEAMKALLDKHRASDISLGDLSKEARKAEEFQEAYLAAHIAMSREGNSHLGKRSSLFRALKDVKKDMDSETGFFGKKTQKARGDSLQAGYDSLKASLLGDWAGGELKEYNYKNKRLQTYEEERSDLERQRRQKDLEDQINRKTIQRGTDVLRPEYLAKIEVGNPERAARYQKLADKQIEHYVNKKITGGDNPLLMGERYMSEKMTDTEFREAIDRTIEMRDRQKDEDRYLKTRYQYEDKDDELSKATLQLMEERQDKIEKEFNWYINKMNLYRMSSGMPAYKFQKNAKGNLGA
jgi:type IV secretion system protein VirB6